MLSYWEKASLLHYDVIIVGSGIVGLSTAASVKEQSPHKRVMVLERGLLPTGASTKNAGFACIGSLTEILDDLAYMQPEEVLQLVNLRYKGLNRLRKRLGDAAIDYAANGSFELISEAETAALDKMEAINEMLEPMLGGKAFSLADEHIAEFGFSSEHTKHLVQNNFEGQLHSGKAIRSLIDYCLQMGIEIKTGCEVVAIDDDGPQVHVRCRNAVMGNEIAFTAGDIAICTNAFTRSLYPELEIQPGRGQVLVTEPIPNLPFKGIYHFDKGFYYFRELEGRILFGGGRNLDFEGERTTEFAFNELIREALLEKLRTVIIPGIDFKVSDWWTGIMAFGSSKFPIIKQHSPRVCVGVRMGGMGVAIGSEAGDQLAAFINRQA